MPNNRFLDTVDWPACRAGLDEGARALGVALTEAASATLIDYLRQLVVWNNTHNLTAVRDPRAMVARHLLDSLAVLEFIVGRYVADIGSGPGLPGLALAIAQPRLEVTLIESNYKKCAFLRHVRRQLQLHNVNIVAARVETWRPDTRLDCAICRAFAPVDKSIRLAGHLIAPGGRFLLMKGRDPGAELATLPLDFSCVDNVALDVPKLGAPRHLVILEAGSRDY